MTFSAHSWLHPHSRNPILILPPMNSNQATQIFDTLDAINNAGYNGIGRLLRSMLASNNPKVSQRVSRLIYTELDAIIEALAEHPQYGE